MSLIKNSILTLIFYFNNSQFNFMKIIFLDIIIQFFKFNF